MTQRTTDLRLLVKDADGRVHEPVVTVTVENANFLKLAAINGMQLVGARTEQHDG